MHKEPKNLFIFVLFLPHHLEADGHSGSEHTYIQTVPLKSSEKYLSEVGQCSYTAPPKKPFFSLTCFLVTLLTLDN